jgi:hypothetical protein
MSRTLSDYGVGTEKDSAFAIVRLFVKRVISGRDDLVT